MITNLTLTISAAQPGVPLTSSAVVAGSAATFCVEGLPTASGVTIDAVAVTVTNADGVVESVAAVQDGEDWFATFPATHFATPGTVEDGVVVSASGTDENGAARTWIAGRGALRVLSSSAVPEPGETVTNITDKTLSGETFDIETGDGQYGALKTLITKLGGTVAALALAACTAYAAPPPGYTNDTYSADGVTWTRHGSINTRSSYVVTDATGGGGGGGMTTNDVQGIIGTWAASGDSGVTHAQSADFAPMAGGLISAATGDTATLDDILAEFSGVLRGVPVTNSIQEVALMPTGLVFSAAQGIRFAPAQYDYEFNLRPADDLPWSYTWLLPTPDDVTATRPILLASTNDIAAAISTNNPAFVAAVTNCPVVIAAQDAIDLGEFGSFGTIGAALAALAAAVAALKRGKADASALRYSLTPVTPTVSSGAAAATLNDRAANAVDLSAEQSAVTSIAFTAPAAVAGKARSFIVRVTLPAQSDAPQWSLSRTGETIELENAGGELPALATDASVAATTLLYFTETAAGVFLAKGETAKAVA